MLGFFGYEPDYTGFIPWAPKLLDIFRQQKGYDLQPYLLTMYWKQTSSPGSSSVRVQPDFWRAQYELGAVLIQKGDTTAAVEHLTLAAKGDDRDSASAAQAWLQRLKH